MKFRCLERAYIGDRVIEADGTVDVPDDFVPGPYMQPMDAKALKAAKFYRENPPQPTKVEDRPYASFVEAPLELAMEGSR